MSVALLDALAQPLVSSALLWRLDRNDGLALGFTTHDRDLRHGGLLYRASPGATISAIAARASFDDDGITVQGPVSIEGLSARDIALGRWREAALAVDLIDWDRPDLGAIGLFRGRVTGLLVSGMVDTTKVQGWLDVFGAWDPTLEKSTASYLAETEIFGSQAALVTSWIDTYRPNEGILNVCGELNLNAYCCPIDSRIWEPMMIPWYASAMRHLLLNGCDIEQFFVGTDKSWFNFGLFLGTGTSAGLRSPALCALLLRKKKPVRGPLGAFFRLFNTVFDKSTSGYVGVTRLVTRKIVIGVIFVLILTAAMGVLGKGIPGGFMPEEDMGYLMVNIQLPDAASLQRTDAICKKVEEIIRQHEEVAFITTAAGYSLLSGSMASNAGFIFVSLKDWAQREITANQLVSNLNLDFFLGVNEAQVFAFGPPAIPGLGNGSGFSLMIQDKVGNTPAYLAEETGRFIQAAMSRPEIGAVFTTFRANVPQRYMDIDKDKALKAGVSLNSIYTTVGAFLGGSYVNDFNRFGRLYKVYIQAEPQYRINEDQIDFFYVNNKGGKSVPLATFVNIHDIVGPDYTNRYNLYRAVELTGSPAHGYTSAQAMAALEETAGQVLPGGMGYEWSNMSYQEKKAAGTGSVVFIFSLVFVFLILAAQYESWSLPLSILMGTPFAIFGAFLALFLARMASESYELNVFAQIALVMLIAMAAKNAILIVEFAKLEFDKGASLFEAAIKGARLRFRPILMTAFSFILGVLPLVVATGAGAEARVVMGMALLGGMTLATLLGVFFYPLFFVLIGKIGRYEKKRREEQEKRLEAESKKVSSQ